MELLAGHWWDHETWVSRIQHVAKEEELTIPSLDVDLAQTVATHHEVDRVLLARLFPQLVSVDFEVQVAVVRLDLVDKRWLPSLSIVFIVVEVVVLRLRAVTNCLLFEGDILEFRILLRSSSASTRRLGRPIEVKITKTIVVSAATILVVEIVFVLRNFAIVVVVLLTICTATIGTLRLVAIIIIVLAVPIAVIVAVSVFVLIVVVIVVLLFA